jgi:hypothetical protein
MRIPAGSTVRCTVAVNSTLQIVVVERLALTQGKQQQALPASLARKKHSSVTLSLTGKGGWVQRLHTAGCVPWLTHAGNGQ